MPTHSENKIRIVNRVLSWGVLLIEGCRRGLTWAEAKHPLRCRGSPTMPPAGPPVLFLELWLVEVCEVSVLGLSYHQWALTISLFLNCLFTNVQKAKYFVRYHGPNLHQNRCGYCCLQTPYSSFFIPWLDLVYLKSYSYLFSFFFFAPHQFVLRYLIDRSRSFLIQWLARKDIETCYALLFSCVIWGSHCGVLPAERWAQGTHVALWKWWHFSLTEVIHTPEVMCMWLAPWTF